MFLFWNNEKTPTANELKQTFTVAKASDKNGKKKIIRKAILRPW